MTEAFYELVAPFDDPPDWEDVLRRAGIDTADVFIAATNLDNVNAMAGQIAQLIFRVPRVIARLYDPIREEVYQTAGLTTVCPTKVGAERIKQMLDARWARGEE
jgi:trk system potassium uptake protein TrkA